MPLDKPQVIGTNEEALYIIDALCNHESDLHIHEHYTDTAGSTEHVFALSSLLGFRFAPRISDALCKKLYVPGEVNVSGALSTLVCEQVNTKLIGKQWDEMRRVACILQSHLRCTCTRCHSKNHIWFLK
jgi:TnpA family transposase